MRKVLILLLSLLFVTQTNALARHRHSYRVRVEDFSTGKWHYLRIVVPPTPMPFYIQPLIVPKQRAANRIVRMHWHKHGIF